MVFYLFIRSNASFLEVCDHMCGLWAGAISEVHPVAGVEAVMGREAGGDIGEADLRHEAVLRLANQMRNTPALIGC